jgi:preprotein translocase subunit SecA
MALEILDRALRFGEKGEFRRFEKRVAQINAIEAEMQAADDLLEVADELRERARTGETLEELLPETFALVREAGRRTLGQRHYDVQLIGGQVLHDGSIAEMKTGEGKTLTATLAVFLNTLKGDPVHVVTVNDYLAHRDATWMMPIYHALGASVAYLAEGDDPATRAEKYRSDIVYGTNSEFGFDYLRDNMAESREERVQRGHSFAIVDEVDNILIDEARTPLIISGAPESAAATYTTFARLAGKMKGVQARVKLKSEGATRDTSRSEYDFEYDPKHKTVAPTERGVEMAENFLGVDNLYLAENGNLVNHLQQALKAKSLYQRDKDYAVHGGEVLIIDEFTGRILEGRRWSEGLHQAVEAKEGVAIREENQTLASITLQNYFRMYEKLSGMTGTALTEAREFMKIYETKTVPIPTHKEMIRLDQPDLIYKTAKAKWDAVVKEITERHEKGQPVLVGTVSVATSEMLSRRLKKGGIEHVVLNAKPEYAEREGETVAYAGRSSRVTIATNMAGRGVDIKLGGDAEAIRLAREMHGETLTDDETKSLEEDCTRDEARVREAGGLFILGTERHESRRIDNQLRGRAGRQGDPGETRFFLAADDELLRMFAGDKIEKILERLGEADDTALESRMLTRAIEEAQKKVEEQNFLSRKHVLEYDDVLNEQRRVIYRYRNAILDGEDLSLVLAEKREELIDYLAEEFLTGDDRDDWDKEGFRMRATQLYPGKINIEDYLRDDDKEGLAQAMKREIDELYQEIENDFPEIRDIERSVLLAVIDAKWREHLYDMDYLREGIHLRSFAQIEPLVAYKNEGYALFEELVRDIFFQAIEVLFRVEREEETEILEEEKTREAIKGRRQSGEEGKSARGKSFLAAERLDLKGKKIGRNEVCPCGSGKKYKKCHGV